MHISYMCVHAFLLIHLYSSSSMPLFLLFFFGFSIYTGGGITFVYGDNGIQLSQCKTFRCRRRFETETICITRLAENAHCVMEIT